MLKSLAWKELRESLPLVALALIAQFGLYFDAMGLFRPWSSGAPGAIPFVSDSGLRESVLVVSLALAFALGITQVGREAIRGTFPFLLHRPLLRDKLFLVKLACGALVCLLATALPVLIYALWAAAPGTHASPFEWSMTLPAWRLCLAVLPVYFAAFLVALRPARWWGSRCLPLVAAIPLVILQASSAGWLNVALCLLADALFVLAILHVAATRDYS